MFFLSHGFWYNRYRADLKETAENHHQHEDFSGLSLQTPLTHLIYIAWFLPRELLLLLFFSRIDCRWRGIHLAE